MTIWLMRLNRLVALAFLLFTAVPATAAEIKVLVIGRAPPVAA